MRYGILGGTFDPPHIGHTALALGALKTGWIDRVLLIPTCTPPHKYRADISDAEMRYQMCEIIANKNPSIEVSRLELQRCGVSYTIDTIKSLRAKYSDGAFRLIIGGDMALQLATWRAVEDVIRLAPPMLVTRPGAELPQDYIENGPQELSLEARTIVSEGRFTMEPIPISSTEIRERIAAGQGVDTLLDPDVAEYIKAHKLYR